MFILKTDPEWGTSLLPVYNCTTSCWDSLCSLQISWLLIGHMGKTQLFSMIKQCLPQSPHLGAQGELIKSATRGHMSLRIIKYERLWVLWLYSLFADCWLCLLMPSVRGVAMNNNCNYNRHLNRFPKRVSWADLTTCRVQRKRNPTERFKWMRICFYIIKPDHPLESIPAAIQQEVGYVRDRLPG